MNIIDIKKLVLPRNLFVEELYNATPGYRVKQQGYNFYELITEILITASGGLLHSSLDENFNGTYTFNSPVNPPVLIDTRASSNPTDTTGLIPIANTTVQLDLEWLHQYVLNAQNLFGNHWVVGPTSPTLGAFTGWTITDNLDIKTALQELELAIQDSMHLADNGLTKVVGTGIGAAQSKTQLGGALTQDTTIAAGTKKFNILAGGAADISFKMNALPAYGYNPADSAVYLEGGSLILTDRAISGIRYDGVSKFIPFMFSEDLNAATSKLIEVADTEITVTSFNSDINVASSIWDITGVTNKITFSAGLVEEAYTTLSSGKFRIGSVSTITPAVTEHYDLPLVDGTSGQAMVTNGAGTASWQDNTPKEHIQWQEFLSTELVSDRTGTSMYVIPLAISTYVTKGYQWSVSTPNTGTFTMELEINGVTVPGSSVAVTASEQNGTVAFTSVVLANNDRIRVVTSASVGTTPAGLVIMMAFSK